MTNVILLNTGNCGQTQSRSSSEHFVIIFGVTGLLANSVAN